MLSTVITGHADLSDVLLLVAVILFVIVGAVRIMAKSSLDMILVAIGFACVALAWLVL